MTHNTKILQQWYSTVWENGNLDAIPRLLADSSSSAHGSTLPLVPDFVRAPDELQEFLHILATFVRQIRVEILHTLENGDWISAMMEIHCLRRDTGAPVRVRQHVTMRIDGDRIAETYPQFDFMSFFEQLGLLPRDAQALLLSGQKLG